MRDNLQGAHNVNLSHCGQITGAGLAYLERVHIVDLYDCKQITDAGLAHLQANNRSLECRYM